MALLYSLTGSLLRIYQNPGLLQWQVDTVSWSHFPTILRTDGPVLEYIISYTTICIAFIEILQLALIANEIVR